MIILNPKWVVRDQLGQNNAIDYLHILYALDNYLIIANINRYSINIFLDTIIKLSNRKYTKKDIQLIETMNGFDMTELKIYAGYGVIRKNTGPDMVSKLEDIKRSVIFILEKSFDCILPNKKQQLLL